MKMHKPLSLFLALTILLTLATPALAAPEDAAETLLPDTAQTEAASLHPEDGKSSPESSAYETIYLESVEELLAFSAQCRLDSWSRGKRVILMADLSLSQTDFSPIASFGGIFDGNGHTISGLCLTESFLPAGLFGELQATGSIENLTVSGTIAPAGDAEFVGGIVGENYGRIAQCSFTGNLLGSANTGGIAGINAASGVIADCEVSGLIIGSSMTGGIAGCNFGRIESAVNKAYVNTTSVDPSIDPSQLSLDFLTDVSRLKSMDISSAPIDSGGIVGYSSGILRACINKATVGYAHIGYNVGGIAGRSCGFIDSCTNTAAVLGRKDTGGIAGQLEPYISLTLSESALAALERQLQELDVLLDETGAHAQNASQELTDRLDAISSSLSSAASAAQDIRLTGGLASTVLADAVHSSEADLTLTPLEGALEGGIALEDGSLSAGVAGAISKGVSAGREAAASAILDAQTQLDLTTDLAGLSSALSGMAGQMRMLSGELGGASEELLADAARLHDKIDEITQTGFDFLMGADDEELILDSSALDIDQITLGKLYACTNSGDISGDINVGGIAGDMGLEYTLDPEDDLTISLDASVKRQYELRALIQRCKNLGAIEAKRSHCGGIAGKMDLGLIAQCEAYGSIHSESGNYVGGIAGLCSATIRHCFAKCTLSGGTYIGGIVGAGVEESRSGESSTVAGCCSMVTIGAHEQYVGAISGADAGIFLENIFVSDALAGINGVSRAGCAEPLAYEALLSHYAQQQTVQEAAAPVQPASASAAEDADASPSSGAEASGEAQEADLPEASEDASADTPAALPESSGAQTAYDFSMALPEEFERFDLRFVVDGEVVSSRVFSYGASFGAEVFPEIPQKEGYYAHWDRDELKNLSFDTTVTAVYAPYFSALASPDTRSEQRPIFFVEGAFNETDSLAVRAMALTPEEFNLAGGVWDVICKSLRDLTLNTELVEQWQLQLSAEDGAATHTVRYLPPDGDAAHLRIYVLQNGSWALRESELIGSYITFSIEEADVQLAVVHSRNVWWAWLIVAALVILAMVLLLRLLRRRLRQRGRTLSALFKKQHKDAALAEASQSPAASAPQPEPAPAPGGRKKRRWLLPLAIAGALLLGIAGTAAFFLLPDLMADFGAYEAVKACCEQEQLTMTLSGEVRLGGVSYPLNATLERTALDGRRVSSIREQGRTLYYADGAVFLEDGTAYRVDASLPDYSQLLELCMVLYQHADVEAVQNSYTLSASGADAMAIFELLLAGRGAALSEAAALRVSLLTQERALHALTFSGSGQLNDAAHTAYALEVTLTRTDEAQSEIPDAVKDAIAAGDYEDTQLLTKELYALASAWQTLLAKDPLEATLSLNAVCGPVCVQEELSLTRWAQADTPICCIAENGYGLYFSNQAICDSSGSSVPLASAPNAGAASILEILYPLFLHASASCEENGAQRIYTLQLDADGMQKLACAIAPELEKLALSFTSGSARLVMDDGAICSVSLRIDASAQIVLSRVEAAISAALDFSQAESAAQLPEAVRAALAA